MIAVYNIAFNVSGGIDTTPPMNFNVTTDLPTGTLPSTGELFFVVTASAFRGSSNQPSLTATAVRNSVSMTLEDSATVVDWYNQESQIYGRWGVFVFSQTNPTAGSYPTAITISTNGTEIHHAATMGLYINNATLQNTSSGSGTGTSKSINATGLDPGSMMISGCIAANPNGTPRFQYLNNSASSNAKIFYDPTTYSTCSGSLHGAGTVTHSYSWSNSEVYAYASLKINSNGIDLPLHIVG